MAKVVGYDKSAVLRCVCPSCSAIVEYVSKEVHSFRSYDYMGEQSILYYIKCPGCDADIDNVKVLI